MKHDQGPKKHLKKWIALCLTLLLSVGVLAGCGSGDSGSTNNLSYDDSATGQQKAQRSAKKNKEKQQRAKEIKEEFLQGGGQNSSGGSNKSGKASSKSGKSENSKGGNSSSGTKEKQSTCTISINAQRIHASKRANDSVKALVPGSGYLLNPTTVNIEKGDAVKDVLVRISRENGIVLSAKGDSYIAGIGGIFEFDGGPRSGWMYSVNGVFPNVACNEKDVAKGDVIQWKYTLNLGKDL